MGANEEDWSIISSSSDFDDESTTSSRDIDHEITPDSRDGAEPPAGENLDDTISLTPRRRDSDKTQTGVSDSEKGVSESWITGLEPFDGDIDDIVSSSTASRDQDAAPAPAEPFQPKGELVEENPTAEGSAETVETPAADSAVSSKIRFYEGLTGINESLKNTSTILYCFYAKHPLQILHKYVSPEAEEEAALASSDSGISDPASEAVEDSQGSNYPAVNVLPAIRSPTTRLTRARTGVAMYIQSLQEVLESNSAYLFYYISISYLAYSLIKYSYDFITAPDVEPGLSLGNSLYQHLQRLVYEEEKKNYLFFTKTTRTNKILRSYSKLSSDSIAGARSALSKIEDASTVITVRLGTFLPQIFDTTQKYAFLTRNSLTECSHWVSQRFQGFSVVDILRSPEIQRSSQEIARYASRGCQATRLGLLHSWDASKKEFHSTWRGLQQACQNKRITSSVRRFLDQSHPRQYMDTYVANVQTFSKHINNVYRQVYRGYWKTPNLPEIAPCKEVAVKSCIRW